MKILDIIADSNQNLLRNKLRSALTIISIFVGSFAIILNAAINAGVNSFIDDQVNAMGGKGYIVITSNDMIDTFTRLSSSRNSDEPREYDPEAGTVLTSVLKDEDIEKIKQIDGIDAESVREIISPRVTYISSEETKKLYELSVETFLPGDYNYSLAAGEVPADDEHARIILPYGYPKALGFESDEAAIGQTVRLNVVDQFTRETKHFDAKVSAVLAKGIISTGNAYITTSLGLKIYDENTKYLPEEQRNLTYAVQAGFDHQNVSEAEIKQRLDDAGFAGVTVSDFIGSIKSFFDIISTVLMIFGAIALLAASIGIINTLFMSVQERTREIGLDKALGMSSARVFFTFSCEAILLGFWGSVVGIAASVLIGNIANAALHAEGAILEQFTTFSLVKFEPASVLAVTLTIMFIAFLAGTIPARKASKKDPIDALRYE